jgi:hypothetical protein
MIQIPIEKVLFNGSFAIIDSPVSGKTYVVPAWIEVPKGTKMEDIQIIGKKEPVPHKRSEHTINSKSGKTYRVVVDNKLGNSCECIGFMYHRSCRHLKQVIEHEL